MWSRKLKSRKRLIILIAIILTSFVLITLNSRRNQQTFFFETIALWVVSPIQSLFTDTVDSITNTWDHYFYLVDTARENEDLKRKLDEMRAANQGLHEELRRLQRVGRLLDYQEKNQVKSLVANIVGRDATQWIRTVFIDKGTRDGIRENLAVVTDAGVVGHVIEAGPNSSKVLLIVDRRSAVDTLFETTRVPGVIEGDGDTQCIMKYVPVTAKAEVGDWVLSSGLGGIFPKGLMIGRVTEVNKSRQGLFQEVIVKPSADLSRLEEVLVLLP